MCRSYSRDVTDREAGPLVQRNDRDPFWPGIRVCMERHAPQTVRQAGSLAFLEDRFVELDF